MLASRLGRLPLVLSLVAFAVVGGSAITVTPLAPTVEAAAIDLGRGVTHSVDGTLADAAEPRASRTDRHAPRNDLPWVLPLVVFTIAFAAFAWPGSRSVRPAVARLRDSIGRRAPPTLAIG